MLTGKRVTLRALGRDDLPRIWQFHNDLDVELAGGGDPPMPQSYERLLADYDRAAAEGKRDFGWFAIEAGGLVVGQCGIMHPNETARTCELGIVIGDKAYWGNGYGKECVSLLLDYAFRLRNYRRVWLWVHGANERAYRAYLSCGFKEEGRLREHVWSNGAYDDAIYMGVLRSEWEHARKQNQV